MFMAKHYLMWKLIILVIRNVHSLISEFLTKCSSYRTSDQKCISSIGTTFCKKFDTRRCTFLITRIMGFHINLRENIFLVNLRENYYDFTTKLNFVV